MSMTIFDNRGLFFDAYTLFHKSLKISFHDFIDRELSIAFRKPIIDNGKFDDWLHENFGNYEEDGMSMYDVLISNYGDQVAIKIKGLLA